jgi:sugar phosphate isomerase/epimerase
MDQASSRARPLIAFSTLAFPGRRLVEVAELGRQWGYEGVELRLVDGQLVDPAMGQPEREQVRRDLGGFPVVAVDTSVRLVEPAPVPQVRAFLELAADLGAPVVRVFGGNLPDAPGERGELMGQAARALEELASHAERLGVAIGVETHDSFSSSAVVAELVGRVPSAWVGAVWDSHHPCRVGEDPSETYARIGERLLLAQVKDARRNDANPSGWDLVLLGHGDLPLREMLKVLASHGYRRPLSVEWEKRWHPEIEEPEVALPQHIELLRRWVDEIWASSPALTGREGGPNS